MSKLTLELTQAERDKNRFLIGQKERVVPSSDLIDLSVFDRPTPVTTQEGCATSQNPESLKNPLGV